GAAGSPGRIAGPGGAARRPGRPRRRPWPRLRARPRGGRQELRGGRALPGDAGALGARRQPVRGAAGAVCAGLRASARGRCGLRLAARDGVVMSWVNLLSCHDAKMTIIPLRFETMTNPEPQIDQAIASLTPEQRSVLEMRARLRLKEDMGDISREGDAL